jgi:hypothetical protein
MATRSSPELLCPIFLVRRGREIEGRRVVRAFCQCGRPTYQANISSLNAQEEAPAWREGGGAVLICHPPCAAHHRAINFTTAVWLSTLFLCGIKMKSTRPAAIAFKM